MQLPSTSARRMPSFAMTMPAITTPTIDVAMPNTFTTVAICASV